MLVTATADLTGDEGLYLQLLYFHCRKPVDFSYRLSTKCACWLLAPRIGASPKETIGHGFTQGKAGVCLVPLSPRPVQLNLISVASWGGATMGRKGPAGGSILRPFQAFHSSTTPEPLTPMAPLQGPMTTTFTDSTVEYWAITTLHTHAPVRARIPDPREL